MPGNRRASRATPASDWLITAVGPPPWATRILCDMNASLSVLRPQAIGAARVTRKKACSRFGRRPRLAASDTLPRRARLSSDRESLGGRATAPVPDLVGSSPPGPYHFRARIQSFQADAAPFPGFRHSIHNPTGAITPASLIASEFEFSLDF